MRVICIDGVKAGTVDLSGNLVVGKSNEIYEGECYTVYFEHIWCGEKYYLLYELPELFAYKARRFVPLSNIDEMELLKERYGVEAENEFA